MQVLRQMFALATPPQLLLRMQTQCLFRTSPDDRSGPLQLFASRTGRSALQRLQTLKCPPQTSAFGQERTFAAATELTMDGRSFGSGEDARLDCGRTNMLCSSELNR